MEPRGVILDREVLPRNQNVVILALVPLVGKVEPRFAAVRVVHLLAYNGAEDVLLAAALLPALESRDVVDGFQWVVVARTTLREGVVGLAQLT